MYQTSTFSCVKCKIELRANEASQHGKCDTPKHPGSQGANFLVKDFLDFRGFSSENPQKTDF